MAVVGSAEVVVRAITSKVKQDIAKAFNDAAPEARKAGEKAGQNWADGFGKSASSGVQRSLGDTFGSSAIASDAQAGGHTAGAGFSAGFTKELDGLNLGEIGRNLGEGLALGGAAGIGGGGGRLGGAAESSFGGAGRQGGSAFMRNFNAILDSGWASTAVAASRAFTPIYAMANIGGVAISGLVASISTLVSGLFAVVSAASAAAGAIAVLPGLVGVLAQSMAGLRLAFGGIGEAVKAGMEPATASVNRAGGAAAANAYAVADARKALARATADAARVRFDADQRVADAARGVAEAEQDLLNITKQLNAARREAAESLQQLAFDAEDAALAEERAALRLEDAHAALVAAQELPADDKARREAELSYKEAELAYRQAKDRNADMAKEQKRAAKAGIEGSEEVRSVRERQAAAEQTLADRQRALADAQLQRQRALADSSQRIADAQEALRRAQESANKATAAAAAPVDKYAEAMAKLSPQARSFVEYLVSLQDEFQSLRNAAGAELFPRLERALRPIVSQLFPVLEEQLRETGRIWGDYAIGVSNALTRGSLFENLLRSQNETMNVFNRRGDNGRTVMDDLATVFLRLMTAIQPLTRRFARWIARLIEGMEAATDTRKEMDRLTGRFNKAGDRAALLGRIFKNLFGVFSGLGKAADKSGEGMLRSLNKWLRELNKFVNSDEGREKLEKYFDGVTKNMRALARLTRRVGRAFGALGDNEGISEFAEAVSPAVDNMGKLADQMTGAGGSFGEFVTNISELMVVLGDTGGIELFFDVLNKALSPIVSFAKSEWGGKFLVVVGAIAAATRALSLIRIVGNKGFQILLGGPIAFVRALRNLRTKGIGPTVKSLLGIKPASDKAKDALDKQIATDKAKTEQLEKLAKAALDAGAALELVQEKGLPDMPPGAVPDVADAVDVPDMDMPEIDLGLDDALDQLDDFDVRTNDMTAKKPGMFKRMGSGIGGAFKKMGGGISALVGGPFGLLMMAIPLLIKGFTLLFQKSPEFRKFVKTITDAVMPVVKAIGTWLLGTLSKLFGWVNKQMPTIRRVMGDVFEKISGVIHRVFIPAFKTAWSIIKPILKLIWEAAKVLFTAIKLYITKLFIPFWKLVWKAIQGLWTVAKAVFNRVREAWKAVIGAFKKAWENGLRPAIERVKNGFQSIWTKVKAVGGWIRDRWNWVKDKFNDFRAGMAIIIERVKSKFQEIVTKVTSIVTAVRGKFADFKGHLDDIWNKVKGVVGNIKSKFGEIAGSVTSAFKGLAGKAVGPLNSFIRFLNNKVIGNVNKLTEKFGLKIGTIPEVTGFQKGGWTGPGPASKVAGVVHADEFVFSKAKRRAIERKHPGLLERMHRTGTVPGGTGGFDIWPGDAPDLGLGKLRELAGVTIGGIKNIGEKIAKDGLGKVLESLIKTAQGGLEAFGIRRKDNFMEAWFHGIMDKLASYAKDWGGKSGDQPGGKIPSRTRNGYTYNGPPGGWAHPVFPGAPVTQWPNTGHSPWNAIDFDGVTGDAIHAASKGIVDYTAKWTTSYGYHIVLAHANGIRTLYAHLSSILVKPGQKVRTGMVIGRMGSTGRSTGSHLHFEVRGINSADFLRSHGVRLARGGVVQATPGGVLATIGEAGRNERVEPLAYDGFSSRDRAMIDLIKQSIAAGQGGKGDTFHVHPAPGMNEAELAQMVSRRVAWRRSVGT